MPKVLPVPYFIQPTAITCQSTVLKMVAAYLDQYLNKNVKYRNVLKIWRTINKSANRPIKMRNHYLNMKQWLENEFPNIFDFPMKRTVNPKKAVSLVIKIINAGFPVIASTNHTRTKGHVILIIGYKLNYSRSEYSRSVHNEHNTLFVCHDPYGRFDPRLKSNKYSGVQCRHIWGKKEQERMWNTIYRVSDESGQIAPDKMRLDYFIGLRKFNYNFFTQNYSEQLYYSNFNFFILMGILIQILFRIIPRIKK